MTSWRARAFAMFSIFWGVLIAFAVLILLVMSWGNLTDGPDESPRHFFLMAALVVSGAGAVIWYGFYRMMLRMGGKS